MSLLRHIALGGPLGGPPAAFYPRFRSWWSKQWTTRSTCARTAVLGLLFVLGACTQTQELALLPLPKGVEYTGGSVKASSAVTERIVEAIPEAKLNENEAYRLTVAKDGITLEATTERGLWNGRQTLRQLQRFPVKPGMMRKRIPCCNIVDWPSFRVRGWMMDVGRTYVSLEELKREVDVFSQFKVNVFHLHLTEHEAWRLESKRYPQLNAPENMMRQPGKFYTQDEMRELDAFCRERGVTLIPELDIPGHSGAFERAMGFGMQTPEGKAVLRELLEEVFDTFSGQYVHIGTDEVAFTDSWLISEMVAYIRAHGRKALSWNPGWPYRVGEIDGLQLWSYRGQAKEGIPAVDCRLHYINHFDLFGDLIGLHTSTIYGQTEGSDDIAGSIVALWNDRYLTDEVNILKENNLYASVITLADRAWRGGGYQYFDDFGTVLPDEGPAREDFLDFERRMLAYREIVLKDAPMAYVAQGQARWAISKAYPNGGDLTQIFPPEEGVWETDRVVTGSGLYFRHVWGPGTVAGYYPDPQSDHTVYARTKVWSSRRQTVGLLFETQNYSRSERDPMPPQGAWDFRGSRLWLNGTEVAPPQWEGSVEKADYQEPFGNANCAGRSPLPVVLDKGWNDVLIKLPVGAFSTWETRLVKWMFTCAFTTIDGRAAAEVKYDTDFSTSSK